MNKPYRDHEEATIASFQADPEFAVEYLKEVLEDGNRHEIQRAIHRWDKAFGDRTRFSEDIRIKPLSGDRGQIVLINTGEVPAQGQPYTVSARSGPEEKSSQTNYG